MEHTVVSKIIRYFSSRKLLWLGLAGAGSLVLYLLLAWRYPLGPSLENPRASWSTMVGATGLNAAIHFALYLGVTLLYLWMLRLLFASREEPSAYRSQMKFVVFTWFACSAVLMFAAPAGESHDVFDYIFRGRMMAEYRANPLVDVPADFKHSTPYARYLAWRKHVDTYGPVWEASSAAVAVSVRQTAHWLGWWDESYPVCPRSMESCRLLMLYVTGYRLLAVSLTGLSGWLIVSMVSRVGTTSWSSLHGQLALAIWLLNPLTLIATAVGAHNDAVLLVLVLLSCWLLQRRRPLLAVMVLILAAHVKLTALIWLPVCTLWIVRVWGWKRALQIGLISAAAGLVLSWLLYAPFGGWQSLPRMMEERSAFLANSPWRILKYQLINAWDVPNRSAHRLSTYLPSVLFAVGALVLPLRIFGIHLRRSDPPIDNEELDRMLWRSVTGVSMLYLLVGAFWFQHWYVLWALATAALLPERQFTRSVLPWLTFGALLSNAAMDFLLATVTRTVPALVQYVAVVAIIWGPPLLAITFLVLAGRRAHATPSHSRDLTEPGIQQNAFVSSNPSVEGNADL